MRKTAFFIACAGLMIAGIGLAAPQSADAGIRVSFGSGHYGHGHYGHGHGHYGLSTYGRGYYGGGIYTNSWYNRPSYGGYYGGGYYGGGHYDYHPTTIVPHGNHYDVIPGHYHYHRGGHYGW